MSKKLAAPFAAVVMVFVVTASNAAPPIAAAPTTTTPSADRAKGSVYPALSALPPLATVMGVTGAKGDVVLSSIGAAAGSRPIAYGVPYGNLMVLYGTGMGDLALNRRVVLVANGRRIPLIVSVWTSKQIRFFAPTIEAMGQALPGAAIDATLNFENDTGKVLATLANLRFGANLYDADRDGHLTPLGNGDDCDDFDANRYPGRTEVPDAAGHDEDCDYNTYGCADADNDRYCDARACNVDPQGRRYCGDDCDDSRSSVHPAQVDVCNGRDDNCNGLVDEELLGCPTTPR
jgi:hypothetical protein